MNKLLVICGPTATGKTALGIKLAKKFNGEIVSADSRQVYLGMDVGTGKDLPKSAKLKVPSQSYLSPSGTICTRLEEQFWAGKQMGYYLINGVKIWLYDVVDPDRDFSVADYYELAWKVMKDIWQRGKLPIIVGGTGFYVKAVVDGIESLGIEQDWELRDKLSNYPIIKLTNYLKELNPQRWQKMNESDRKNPRRLIRAIEIATYKQRDKGKTQLHPKPYTLNPLFIGLTAPYEILYQRIDQRVEKRVKMGAEQEVKNLLTQGYSWDLPSMSGMGYREWQPYFGGQTDLRETIKRWKFDEHGYARRQMTWFKKDKRICWFDITQPDFEKAVEKWVAEWYNNHTTYAAQN